MREPTVSWSSHSTGRIETPTHQPGTASGTWAHTQLTTKLKCASSDNLNEVSPSEKYSSEAYWPAILRRMGQEKVGEIQEFHLEKEIIIYIILGSISFQNMKFGLAQQHAVRLMRCQRAPENLPSPGWWSTQQSRPVPGKTQTSASPAHKNQEE